MKYNLNQIESLKISEHFGQEFHNRVLIQLDEYSKRWKLEKLELIDYYSVNCLFLCHSELYGEAVLKIYNSSEKEFTSECNSLREFRGRKICNLFDYDTVNQVMLIEQIIPGKQLKEETSLDKRLSAFSSLFNGLHMEPEKAEIYDTYLGWVCRITEYMEKIEGHYELTKHMQKARDICLRISSEYDRIMLLHGDFHYDNILMCGSGYKIIDPKGVVGDPVFDVPRYTLNEYSDSDGISFEERIKLITKVIKYFEKSLGIPSDIQKQCLYVEMAMSVCWNVESNNKPEMDGILFAEYLMNNS